jgi:hypothetical protein
MKQVTTVKGTACGGGCLATTLVCAVESAISSSGTGPYACEPGAHLALFYDACSEPIFQICAWDT